MWIHKDGGQGVIFGCRYINQAYLDSYAKIAREQPDGRIPVDDLIKDINLSALANPVRKQRLTTMVPMDVN
ncbi:hypothetical protein GLOTRDRAFT_109139 [Gloeophyllum trabeum ATCC 11539]|uniref:Uncharacterized protein n=1 Tax=Gloeophyllum trabeum (strain ATCC 11539 / FP-39264 / Madison 617) TaxID=670483 RepID=S7QMZ7_GLOTA|nr:uncharacterized protein GLOTRDRAFT_109139 [Gloeophyllum trabeum ATCC 11539]EPQ60787.1 hypothetical protein GLOTRDRAFT_109139 [Gloeophyllum trabeum ATCC 11539]